MPPKVTNFHSGQEVDIVEIEDNLSGETEGIRVKSPSGARYYVLNEKEAEFYDHLCEQYLEHNKFSNISDLQELDRLLIFELRSFRLSSWSMAESDYEGRPVSKDLQRDLKDLSKEIREIKTGLGIDKKTRDAGQGDTIADKWEFLKEKAKEFAWMRNEQVIKAHTNWKELEAKITGYRNSTPQERRQFGLEMDDILEWLDEKFREFDEIDEAFQESQKIWIRKFQA